MHAEIARTARQWAEVLLLRRPAIDVDAPIEPCCDDQSIGQLFASIADAMSRHRLKLPADLLLLIKSVPMIESVGRQLDPSFKIAEHAAPFVESLIEQQHSPGALALRTADAGREVLSAFRSLPGNLAEIARKARSDSLQIQFVHRNLGHFIREMDRSSNRLSFAIVIAAIVIASSIMVHAAAGPQAFGYPLLGLAGFLAADVLGLGLAVGIFRSGASDRSPRCGAAVRDSSSVRTVLDR